MNVRLYKRFLKKSFAKQWKVLSKLRETAHEDDVIKTFRILIYHSIHPSYPLSIRPANFERQMKYLADNKFRVISLDRLQDFLDAEEKGNFIILSFDDGYADNFDYAFPILKDFNLPAIIFLATRFINQDKFDDYYQNARFYPGLRFLNWKQIDLMLSHGISFGSHTHSHIDLDNASSEEIEKEIITSKEIIEEKIGKAVHFFAYPFGQLNNINSKAVGILNKFGFKFAFSSIWGGFKTVSNPYILPRCLIDYNDTLEDFQSKLSGFWDYFRYVHLVKGLIKKAF